MDMDQLPSRMRSPGAIAAGAVVLTLGVAMLVDRSGAAHIRLAGVIGPLFLIVLGASILLEKGTAIRVGRRQPDEIGVEPVRPRQRRDGTNGLWLIGIGLWMMVSQLHLFGLDYGSSWPIFIILAGVMIMIRGVR